MDEAPPRKPDDEADSERERRRGNLALLIVFAVLVGAGVWLVNAMLDQRTLDNCLAQGRRDCGARIDVPAR